MKFSKGDKIVTNRYLGRHLPRGTKGFVSAPGTESSYVFLYGKNWYRPTMWVSNEHLDLREYEQWSQVR